jgi:MinD-like ATPase involved in chromosome partitioning or flagellar assembly
LHTDNQSSFAVVILAEAQPEAESLARMLVDLSIVGSRMSACIPPVRGIDFFADAQAQRRLDRWWDEQIPSQALPIFIVEHCEGLAEWLSGLDGRVYVGVTSSAAADVYQDHAAVRAITARSPLDYAAAVMSDLVTSGIYSVEDAERMLSLASALPEPGICERVAPLPGSDVDEGPDPFDLLIAMNTSTSAEAQAQVRTTTPASTRPAAPERRGLRLPGWARRPGTGGDARAPHDQDLANDLLRRGSTIVAVGSRKGGVGKTSHAAGVAIVAGAALDAVGRCAAIIDANLANPDAWGQLNLPSGAATVRDMIAALASNQEPPRPVHASTPALACYPESREASEYSRTEIGMLVAHLRSRYPIVVVDLSNRLPDPTGGPEAAAAAYWLEHADVLVLPSAASKQDYNGVLDYLDIADMPPVIVAALVPRTRRNREHPLAKRYMSAIEHRAYRVVDIPDDAELVRYAGMQGVPVEAVSASLKAAYRHLAEAIASAPEPVRS